MISLSRSRVAEVFAYLEGHYPHEACGLFVGRRGEGDRPGRPAEGGEDVVTQAPAIPNLNTERAADRYELDPRGWMAAEKAARARGEIVLGVYHSHPDHPARPSQTDLDRAWPELVYMIVAIRGGKAAEWTCWILNESAKRFDPVAVHLTD